MCPLRGLFDFYAAYTFITDLVSGPNSGNALIFETVRSHAHRLLIGPYVRIRPKVL